MYLQNAIFTALKIAVFNRRIKVIDTRPEELGSEVIKLYIMLKSTEVESLLLINVKMPTIDGFYHLVAGYISCSATS